MELTADSRPLWKQFEDLAKKVLEFNGFIVEPNDQRGDRGFDFRGLKDNEPWAIEVKYYRTARAQPRLVQSAAMRVVTNGLSARSKRGMLIVSCRLPPDLRAFLEKNYKITFVDRTDLTVLASGDPALLDELQSVTDDTNVDTSVTRSLKPFVPTDTLENNLALQLDTKGTELCQKLRGLRPGKKTWAEYETLCAQILNYLFPNDLLGWEKQRRTDDGINRFDLICRIKPATEFWEFLVDQLNSRYILFEFKNYSRTIKQGQILTTEKYLLAKALRRVAIILTRHGGDNSARAMAQGAMREHGKLMLIVDDSKLCEMLEMKQRGEDPTDCLFELSDQFLLSLPR